MPKKSSLKEKKAGAGFSQENPCFSRGFRKKRAGSWNIKVGALSEKGPIAGQQFGRRLSRYNSLLRDQYPNVGSVDNA
jgi:hypothetical protein